LLAARERERERKEEREIGIEEPETTIPFYHMHTLADERVVLVFTTHVGEKTRRRKLGCLQLRSS
jgi:hypothetical protein